MPENPLLELIYGQGAHVSPLASVEDLPAHLAGASVSGFPHTVWQLLWHMNYWMDYERKRIEGHAPLYPEHAAGSWPTGEKPANDAEWKAEVAALSANLEGLARLAETAPERLARPLEVTDPAHTRQSNSALAVLWQTVVHNSYHVGQIVQLRRALGAWPPKGGGDTW